MRLLSYWNPCTDKEGNVESSIATREVQYPRTEQLSIPTWGVLVILVVVMIGLKLFIYIKDEKRHGK